ncbi:cytochrome P450 4g15-like [Halyomorpha halys]|uniref:cytochrome P450 4g15-like n=1 Tax=Halyomorpha halys TaxID=286706 RepID=UPI0006D4F691|nr:cytochrome P450 4g15-like [Halyomorpha halys]
MDILGIDSILVAGLTAAIAAYGYFWFSRRRLYELSSKIPGPAGYPFIGNAFRFIGGADKLFKNVFSRTLEYGDVVKMWVGPRLLVFLTNPADIELILSSHVHIDKAPEYRLFEPWLGDGLLISTGEKWRNHRKLIAPTFHLNILKSFIPTFNSNSVDVVKKLKQDVGREFDAHDYMSEATVEILLETAMGVNKKTQKNGYEYAMAVMGLSNILHLRHTKLWLRPDFIFNMTSLSKVQEKLLNVIHSLTRKVFNIRMDEYKKNGSKIISTTPEDNTKLQAEGDYAFGHSKGIKDDLDDEIGEKKRMAFLDLLIDASQGGGKLTNEEIQHQIDTIMFEGHDTTAAGSSFFLAMMAARPDIQEKCVEEVQRIFGDSNRPVTFQDTLEMKYIERCLMETLRMYPPVPIIARELKQELKLASCDLTIPAHCTVVVNTFMLHRKPDIYSNPNFFDPDNFLPEKSASRHYYSYIPFSAGPRSCVGRKYAVLKLKVMLATILRNYRIMPGKKEKDWKLQGDIILKRADGFPLQLEPRAIKV